MDAREPRFQWRGPLWVLFYAAAVFIVLARGFGWDTPRGLLLSALTLAALVFYLYDAVAAERKRLAVDRHALGRCPACGYDLRASPRRCPECGVVPRAPRPDA